MVSRKTKVLAAGLVMAAGVGLAWPFRRTEPVEPFKPAPPAPPAAAVAAPPSVAAGPVSPPPSVAASFAADTKPTGLPKSEISKITPTPPIKPPTAAPVAIAPTEPAAAASLATTPTDPVAEPVEPPAERSHVVHDGDSLERLAKLYLGDESRALEIFDLNRGTLENPHWLPIGVELRIPPRSRNEEI